ncbi:MAG: hypothetical protein C4K49_10525 [Candidatus Thorarchaeota archaeon]|nr:MAG: hypothetical protein C4K49_10525 [Candidatus Thorarchaeota archaeon]
MSQIDELNQLMPTNLDKTTAEYISIFGNETFTSISPIEESSDFQCGAIANELEYVKGFIDYITRTASIDDFYGVYLEKVVSFFTGLTRNPSETDAELRLRFNALVVRKNNFSWLTTWMIRDVFSYFFDVNTIYVVENYVLDDFVVDGSFEIDPTLNWVVNTSGGSSISFVAHDMFYGSTCAEFVVDALGSTCSLSQTLSAVPEGYYILNFFVKDDQPSATSNLFKLMLQRSSDSYYYNFTSFSWQAAATYKVMSKNSSAEYESKQVFVEMTIDDDLTLTFENVGSTSEEYTFWIDRVEFGTMLDYPTIKLIFVDENLGTGYLSIWPSGEDPIATYEYTEASYIEQCYVSGFGGTGLLPYFYDLLEIIRPAGVKSMIEVVWRAHT